MFLPPSAIHLARRVRTQSHADAAHEAHAPDRRIRCPRHGTAVPPISAAVLGVGEADAPPPPPPCRWSWRRLSCRANCIHKPKWRQPWRCAPAPAGEPSWEDDSDYHQRSVAALTLVALSMLTVLVGCVGTSTEPPMKLPPMKLLNIALVKLQAL